MIEHQDLGDLQAPVLIAAFEGWNDAGEASTAAIRHLIEVWDAQLVAEIDPEDYYDFQVTRPTIRLIDGDVRQVTWPTSRLFHARAGGEGGKAMDVLLLAGIEPNMRWRSFCAEIVQTAIVLGVSKVVTLGALLADTPHTRPVPVTGTATEEDMISTYGLTRSRYEGPTGIVGVLQDACTSAGITAVSFWAAVAHYASSSPSPKVTEALLHRVEDVVDLAIPLGDLPSLAEEWVRGVNEMVAEDEDIVDYVRQLEEREVDTTLAQASGDSIAKEFEKYLRRRSSD